MKRRKVKAVKAPKKQSKNDDHEGVGANGWMMDYAILDETNSAGLGACNSCSKSQTSRCPGL